MTSYTTPARVRFPRSSITGKVPDTLAPGSFAINWTDQKIYVGDAGGRPVRLTQWLADWSPVLNYRAGDYVVFEGSIYRATRDLTAGTPFNTVDWEPVATSARGEASEPYATSIISGGTVTQINDDTIEVQAGTGIIMDSSNPAGITAREFSWGTFTYTVGTGTEPWVLIGINPTTGANEVTLESFTPAWRRANVMLVAVLWDLSNDEIVALLDASIPAGGTAEAFRDKYFAEGGAFRANGLRVKPSTGLTLALTEGVIYDLGVDWRTDPTSPNTIAIAAQNPVVMAYTSRNRVLSDDTDIDTTQWDNMGVMQAVPAGNATIQYMSISPTGRVFIQYGQRLYPSINAALAGIADDWDALQPYSLLDPVVGLCALVGTPAAASSADVFLVSAAMHGDPYTAGAQASGDTSQFLLLDGSRTMLGPLDMGGFTVENGNIYGGTATGATVDPFTKIRAKNSTTAGAVASTTVAGDRGELYVNLTDRKVYARNASGASVLVADRITDFSASGVYVIGDFVVQGGVLYRASANNGPGAFNPAQWASIGGGGGGTDAILTHPTTADRNTIDLTATPAVKGLVIDGAPNQTANLLEIPGTAAPDTRSAVVDALGFPNDRWGPSIFRVSQPTHGFATASVGMPMAFTGGVWTKANAATATTRAIGVIEQIIDSNTFVIRTGERINNLSTAVFAGGSIVSGTLYYVSDSVAGQLTSTPSTIRPDPAIYTIGTTSGIVLTGTGTAAADFVRKTGDTMTGPLTLSGTNEVRFVDGNTSIYKQSSSPSILVEIAGVTAARFDENDSNAAFNQTVITKQKGDARYMQESESTAFAQAILRMVYPVGALYFSTASANPSTYFPGTTWESYAQGRAIVGVGSADSLSWTVGQTRGEADVALTVAHLAAHSHVVDPPSATSTGAGSHSHGGATGAGGEHHHQMWEGSDNDWGTFSLRDDNTPRGTRGWNSNGTVIYFDNFTGNRQDWWTNGAANRDMGASHTHSITSVGDHTHSVNIPAFDSADTGTGAAHNNVQPSIAVYIFRRLT